MEIFHTASKSLVKDINMSVILRIVRDRGPISRAEIAKLTGLNPATVSSNVGNLMERGVVRELGIGASSGGRKPMLIELNPEAYYVIGVDMGTSDVSTGITDLDGRIQCKRTLPFGGMSRPQDILAIMKRSIRETIDASGISHDKLLGIGIGVHGLVDPDMGVSLFAPAFQWENLQIAEPFAAEFDLPVLIDNDVRAMALGEKWFGQAMRVSNFFFLNIGTGVGSGIYVNGELLKGAHFGAGEIGHIQVVEGGERCFCGKCGCLSTLASGPAIEKRAKQAIEAGESTLLSEMCGNEPAMITGEMIHQAAVQGDPFSCKLLDETGRWIGGALSLVVNLLNPEMVVVGGGVSNGGDYIFQGMKEVVNERAMKNNVQKVLIQPTGLGDDCGIIGAATLILRNLFSNPYQYK